MENLCILEQLFQSSLLLTKPADSLSIIALTPSVSDPQLMQQQALVAQSAYLSPVATVAAVQMQQLAALNPSSIIATPIASITPSSGREVRPSPPAALVQDINCNRGRNQGTV